MDINIIEFFGVMFIVIIVLITDNYLVIGTGLAVAILLGGGSYNPAIKLSLYMNKKLSINELLTHIFCEICGAVVGFTIYDNLLH